MPLECRTSHIFVPFASFPGSSGSFLSADGVEFRMSVNQPDPSKMTPSELRIQWGMMQKELEFRETILIERSHALEKTNEKLEKREEELTTLKVQLEGKDVELKHKRGNLKTRILAAIVSVLFGVSTVLFNYANSLVTAKPPDPNGNVMLGIAGLIYIICAIVTIFMLGGGN